MENLGIDPKLLLAQIINFVLFFVIFKKFMAKPFQSFLKNEAKKDVEKENLLKQAKDGEEKLASKELDLEKKSKKVEAEIIEKAKVEAKKIKEGLLIEARAEISNLKESARKSIEAEKQKIKEESDQKVMDLATKVINSTVSSYLSDEQSHQLTGNMLRNLPQELSKYEN